MRRVVAASAVIALCSGCLSAAAGIASQLRRAKGEAGWFAVKPLLRLDEHGGVLLPPKEAAAGDATIAAATEDQQTSGPYMERVQAMYLKQFVPLYLSADTPCEAISGVDKPMAGPVYVLIHGVGGDTDEWWKVIPTLQKTGAAAMLMFRWGMYEDRGPVVERLVTGLNRVQQCYPDAKPLVVLAHSAGGVLVSFAVSRLKVPAMPMQVLTVASPLAGTGHRGTIGVDEDNTHILNDLGSSSAGYPAAVENVFVTHLRTSAPADVVMVKNSTGYAPNQKGIGVAGAKEIDLPTTLTHTESLFYVATEIAAGRLPPPILK